MKNIIKVSEEAIKSLLPKTISTDVATGRCGNCSGRCGKSAARTTKRKT